MTSKDRTTRTEIDRRDNDYTDLETRFEQKTKHSLVRPVEDAIEEYKNRTKTPFYPDGVSIVIPTYNGMNRLSLEATLTALNQQTFLDNAGNRMEVLVVDDGSTDNTEKMIREIQVRYPLKYIKQENSGPSYARNAGIALSNHEIVVFLDNDVVTFPHTIEEHARVHHVLDNVLLCGSRDYVLPTDPTIQVAAIDKNAYGIIEAQRSSNPKDVLSRTTKKEWRHEWWAATNGLKENDTAIPDNLKICFKKEAFDIQTVPLSAISCNFSARKSKIMRGFVDFPGWGGEDTFFGAELFAAGLYIVPAPSTNVFHIEHEVDSPDGTYTGKPMRDLLVSGERYNAYLNAPITARDCTSSIRSRETEREGNKTFYVVTHLPEKQYMLPFDKELEPLRARAEQDPTAKYELGRTLAFGGRPIEARFILYEALRRDWQPNIMEALAECHRRQGNLHKVKYWLNKAAECYISAA